MSDQFAYFAGVRGGIFMTRDLQHYFFLKRMFIHEFRDQVRQRET